MIGDVVDFSIDLKYKTKKALDFVFDFSEGWERGRHRLRRIASGRRRPRRTLTNPKELLVPSLSSC